MAEESSRAFKRFRFDGFEFRERTGELWRSGERIHLPDQAGKVLLALLCASGDLVTREELMESLWPGKVSGDFEGGLHTAVRKLRKALEDDGAEPRRVGTLPRRGYRLLVPVVAEEDLPRLDERAPPPDAGPTAKRSWSPHWLWVAGSLLVLALAVPLLRGPWTRRSRTLVMLPGGVKLELNYLSSGEFLMGYDAGFRPSEPVHRVTLTRGFWLGHTEVTQAQWRAVMGNDPAYFRGDDKPVEQVSWDDCQTFCQRLNGLDRSRVYRLPTEAEWEYAARAGRALGTYPDPDAFAWHCNNSQGQTHPVGLKEANPWGLHDLIGNVWEWCADGYGPYQPYPQKDPQGPPAEFRSARGGSWLSPGGTKPGSTKCADRATLRYGWAQDCTATDLGFRVAAVPRVP